MEAVCSRVLYLQPVNTIKRLRTEYIWKNCVTLSLSRSHSVGHSVNVLFS